MNKTISKTMMLALTTTLAWAVNANAATFVVNTTADTQDAAPGNGVCADAGGACSLRAAITEANALAGADIITLPAGTYTQALVANSEDLNAGGDFDLTSSMTINGAGSGTTIIQANVLPNTATERVIDCLGTISVAPTVVINDVTVRHGAGGIYNFRSYVTITNSIITGSTAGGISTAGPFDLGKGGVTTITHSTISNNTGCGVCGASTITDSIISNNTGSGKSGAGLVIRSTISGNTGGGIFVQGLDGVGDGVTLINSTVSGNSAAQAVELLAAVTARSVYLNLFYRCVKHCDDKWRRSVCKPADFGITNVKNSIVADNTAPHWDRTFSARSLRKITITSKTRLAEHSSRWRMT